MVGSKVYHPKWGNGIVIDTKFSNMYLYIDFSGLKLWLPRSEVEITTPYEKLKKVEFKFIPEGDYSARWLIEALKYGIVPLGGVEHFTFDRKSEIEKLKKIVSSKKKGVAIIKGEYGSGKTHLIEYMYWWALRNGFAVSRIELDTKDVAPHHPRCVYREIVRNLRYVYNEQELGFRDIMRVALEIDLPEPHIFISPFLKVIKKHQNEPLWNWIEGEKLPREYLDYIKYWKLPVMLDHQTACDIYCYIITGISYILAKLGAKKFLILLDEAETLFHLTFTLEQRMGFYFLKGLISCAQNRQGMNSLELIEKSPLEKGKFDKYGFVHSGVRSVPYAYTMPTNLSLIMALTPTESPWYGEFIGLVSQENIIALTPFTVQDYEEMLNKMIEIYESAYKGFRFTEKTRSELKKLIRIIDYQGIRQFIRVAIETMELFRHHGLEGVDKELIMSER